MKTTTITITGPLNAIGDYEVEIHDADDEGNLSGHLRVLGVHAADALLSAVRETREDT